MTDKYDHVLEDKFLKNGYEGTTNNISLAIKLISIDETMKGFYFAINNFRCICCLLLKAVSVILFEVNWLIMVFIHQISLSQRFQDIINFLVMALL